MKRWSPVPDFSDYEVSTNGKVRSIKNGKTQILKQRCASGYSLVSLRNNGVPKNFAVHRLVYAAFVGPLQKGNHINHKNGIRNDNRLSNLEQISPAENSRDEIKRRYRGLPKLKFARAENLTWGNIICITPRSAARMCNFTGSGSFEAAAKQFGLKPMFRLSGNKIFYKPDVQKMVATLLRFRRKNASRFKPWMRMEAR